MPVAAIALGSNLPGIALSREANLLAAVEALRSLGAVLAVSSFFDTEPVGYTGQPRFLNGALLLQTALEPEALLQEMLRVEQSLGRDRSHGIANGPRTLDLDLLLYGDRVLQTTVLVLPHPRLLSRRFVLEPLAEIAPLWRHPGTGQTMADALKALC